MNMELRLTVDNNGVVYLRDSGQYSLADVLNIIRIVSNPRRCDEIISAALRSVADNSKGEDLSLKEGEVFTLRCRVNSGEDGDIRVSFASAGKLDLPQLMLAAAKLAAEVKAILR